MQRVAMYIKYGVARTTNEGMDGWCQLWRPVWWRARMRAGLFQRSAGVTDGLAAGVQTSFRTAASLNDNDRVKCVVIVV